MTRARRDPAPRVLRRLALLRRARRRAARGQSMVEFALVLSPLLLILGGIIQMGFVFNTQVTITNAAREGARAATIYPYNVSGSPSSPPDYNCSNTTTTKATNDTCRNLWALDAAIQALGTLSKTAPQITAGTTQGSWTVSGTDPSTTCATGSTCTTTYTNGDVVVTYNLPSGITDSDPRTGEQVTVQITYHQDLFIPLIARLLPHDANGRLAQTATVTMVIN